MMSKLPVDPRFPTTFFREVDELKRLEALHNYQILDTPPEKAFDDLTKLAAYICGTPISFVSFITTDRQWLKARTGIADLQDLQGIPRERALCNYAMQMEDVLEIEDVVQDPFFGKSPFDMLDIRFYVGAPLITPEGMPLGTLCALDTVPRRLNQEQREALQLLAREVVAHLELRRVRLQLEEEKQKIEGVLQVANNAAESLFTNTPSELFVKQEQKLVRISTTCITHIEALGDYVNIYTLQERFTVYSTMKELESKLAPRDFTRVHRKYIVRLERILAIEADTVIVETYKNAKQPIPIGNSYKAALLGKLNFL